MFLGNTVWCTNKGGKKEGEYKKIKLWESKRQTGRSCEQQKLTQEGGEERHKTTRWLMRHICLAHLFYSCGWVRWTPETRHSSNCPTLNVAEWDIGTPPFSFSHGRDQDSICPFWRPAQIHRALWQLSAINVYLPAIHSDTVSEYSQCLAQFFLIKGQECICGRFFIITRANVKYNVTIKQTARVSFFFYIFFSQPDMQCPALICDFPEYLYTLSGRRASPGV